jgi:anti-anti-sigma factor
MMYELLERDPGRQPAVVASAGTVKAQDIRGFGTEMSVSVSLRPGDPPIIAISGEIDLASGPYVREYLLTALRRRDTRLGLDLGGVTFIDCAGIRVLLAAQRRAELEEGWIRVVRFSPCVRRVITIAGLLGAFPEWPAGDSSVGTSCLDIGPPIGDPGI